MKIEDVILEIYKFEYKNIGKEIDFILVSEDNYVSLKREMVRELRYSFFESEDIMKRYVMKINGINISFHELITDNRICVNSSSRI